MSGRKVYIIGKEWREIGRKRIVILINMDWVEISWSGKMLKREVS